jgi:thiol-disulfide isomerase/thioredoxin
VKQEINQDRRRFLTVAAAIVAGLEPAMLGSTKSRLQAAGGGLSALRGATAWLNSPPLTEQGLRGHVVLVNFCTYTCINWLRQLPYVRAWAEKYQNRGLVVIGVHTPEFPFEHNLDNVRRAAREMRIEYPFAIDNEFAIWGGFDNRYWPALYVIDAQGRVRHQQFGEGEYERAERVIQQLLAQAGIGGISPELVSVDARGIEAAADWDSLRSPENYVGYDRTEHFASPGGAAADTRRVYAVPARLRLNQCRWTDRLPLSRPGSASRHGTGGARNVRPLSRARGWKASGRCARPRH